MFDEVILTVRKLCESVGGDLETEMIEEHDEKPYEVTEEVFTKKRSDLIDVVEAQFKNGQTEVTLPTVSRSNVTRRSKSCVLKQSEPAMRRTLSDAKRYFTKSKHAGQEPPRNCTSASSQETVRDPRDSVISSSSTSSSNSSYDDEGLAKNMPRYQKKKIRAAMVQTQIPTGYNMKRRTSSTITQDEAILLGVTMSQIGARRSAIGEESEPCTSDEDARASGTWRDSGIDTISSTYTSINASMSDEETDEYRGQRPLSPLANSYASFELPTEEFLSIEVSGELGGHFSKSKKTLGQSPNNMGRYFRIHVKTNIEKLQLQSYVIYKKFRDVIALYEDIESICPDGVVQIEKPDRSIFSKKQNKIQVERLLLSVASNSKLRALEPVINFLKPDCLLSEESTHLTPKTPKCNTPPSSNTENSNSTEAPREHPNSANQSEVEIAKFYTPNVSSGLPGSDHAPQIVHSQNGSAGDHSTLVQRTFKFLNQKSTADHDKMSEDEKYSPFITKDDDGNPLLLMIFSYEKDGYTIEGGTLEQLVEQLYCGTCPDADYIQTFLLGYKLFMQSEELMDMLLQKFVDSESYEEEQGDMVKLRLSNIVAQWLERVWVDFHYSDVMIEKVDKFVQLVSSGHPRFLPVAMKLENTMQKKKREWEESLREEDRQSGSLPGSGCPSPAESPVAMRRSNSDSKNQDTKSNKKRKPISLMETTSGQFARHLHCVDFDLMSKVEIHEYFTYFCRKKDPKYHLLTQHLDNWIHHWNSISAWVTSEILRDENPRQRAVKIERLIDIAKQLKQLFSFNTLYAFVTGFNHSSVMRLKKTWDHVKSSSQTSLNDLEEFMSNVDNFGQYRKYLGKVPKTVCTIPLLSLILRDIEFLNVNSPKLRNGLWNFGKLRLIKNKISELERFKMIKPQNHIQTEDDLLIFCRRLPTIPCASFYDISLEREPKDQPRPARPVSVSSLSSVATSSSS
ncbi:uncharacterized protein LOC134820583 isoform X2 [Bolinopsis microptera]|uniref:uncharacterized protein LOC134820583 isoform X2 n=1 Tax=Bolinopsis microptera TaxID=2820187 RepID=UPI003079DF3F